LQIGELLSRYFGCRVNGSAGFIDNQVVEFFIRLLLFPFLYKVGNDLFGLAAGRTVADGNEINAVFINELSVNLFGFGHFLLRWRWISCGAFQILSGFVNYRYFTTGAESGIN